MRLFVVGVQETWWPWFGVYDVKTDNVHYKQW